MTIPIFPVPDVKPLYFGQGNPGQEALQKAISTLVSLNQAQQEIAAQRAMEADKQATQDAAGKMVAGFLSALGTQQVPGVGLPGQPGTLPFTAENPALTGFQKQINAGVPGRAVLAATNAASGAISSEVARINEAKKVPTLKDRNTEVRSDEMGNAILIDRNQGRAQVVLDEKGQPVKFPRPGADKSPRPFGRYVKDGREYVAWVTPGQTSVRLQPLPEGFAPSGVETEAQAKAAGRFMTSSIAFRQAKGDSGLPKDFVNYMLTQAQKYGSRPMIDWVSAVALDDDVKRQLLNWTKILQNTVYKNSGAAVTVAEFIREFQRIPLQGDSKALREQKLNFTRYDIYADWLMGRNQIQRGADISPTVDIPSFQELWDEPGDTSLTPEQRQRAQSDAEYAQFLREKGLWP